MSLYGSVAKLIIHVKRTSRGISDIRSIYSTENKNFKIYFVQMFRYYLNVRFFKCWLLVNIFLVLQMCPHSHVVTIRIYIFFKRMDQC